MLNLDRMPMGDYKGRRGTVKDIATELHDMRRPMKTADVARFLGQSERNVLRMVHNGQIPAKRLGSQWYYSPRKIAELVGMGAGEG